MVTPEAALAAARKHMGGPFTWAAADCASAACNAWAELWGRDPMAHLRGAYVGPISALRHIRRAGGYLGLMADCADRHGLIATDAPQAGDLVALPGPAPFGDTLTLCIQPGQFAGKGKHGMTVIPGSILGAWTCRS